MADPVTVAGGLAPAARSGVALACAALLGVNAAFGSGAFGVPTNQEISAEYPTAVTPAGFTFAIWGPIFLLQAGGTAVISAGGAPEASAELAPAWVAAWAAEVAWQLVFACAPRPAASAKRERRLAVMAPAAALLLAAQGSMLAGAFRLSHSLRSRGTSSPAAAALLLALPTGMNAAWLAAASGIGLSIVAQLVPALSPVAAPKGAAVLLQGVVGAGFFVAPALGGSAAALPLGLGYAGATAWACFGITKGESPRQVKDVARTGVKISAMSGALTVALAAYTGIAKLGRH